MKRLLHAALGFSLTSLLLSGCEDVRPVDPATSSRYLYVVNPDHNTLSQVDLDHGTSIQIPVGREPTRVFRRDNRIYVTNRAERSVSVFEEVEGVLAPRGTIQTGAEPFGVVATSDRVYVSASQSGVVQEFDASTLALLRSFDVAGEPRGLALHPNGNVLVVASMFGGKVTIIDLASGWGIQKDLPGVQGFDPFTGSPIDLSRRLTSDPVFSDDGSRFAVGGLFLNNTSPIEDPNAPGGGEGAVAPPPGPGGGGGYDQGKIQPMVAISETGPDGAPIVENSMLVSVSSGIFVQEGPNVGNFIPVTGYPSSVTFSDDDQLLVAAIEGGDGIVAIDLASNNGGVGFSGGARAEPAPGIPGGGQLQFATSVAVRTSAAPSSVVRYGNSSIYIHSNFDRTVERVSLEDLRGALRPSPQANVPVSDVAFPGGGGKVAVSSGTPASAKVLARIGIADRVVSAEVDYGRRLFFATNNPKVSTQGSAVSCGTCHFGGRNDGLTWVFTRGPRQTPSVAGDLSLTNPVGWSGDRATVAEDAMKTSQGLMGGQGLTDEDTLAIQSFVNSSRNVDIANKGVVNEQVTRGKALFERSDVACASCHSGPAHTNNLVVPMFGIDVKVRHLVGIAASAPYFHDGSAATLRDVLVRAKDGSMGNTGALSDVELDDLEAYLKTL